jgi:hypothetical protein
MVERDSPTTYWKGKTMGEDRGLDDFIPSVEVDSLLDANRKGTWDASSAKLIRKEQEHIREWLKQTGHKAGWTGTLMGLALSGGGIRSATFSLGVMQALASRNLLKKMDYLSTVSGGGYIGSALTWWLSKKSQGEGAQKEYQSRKGKVAVTKKKFGLSADNFPYGTDDPSRPDSRTANEAQRTILRYLRQHGNYLTPGEGLGLAAGLAVVLRGTFFSVLSWLLTLSTVLFLAIFSSVHLYNYETTEKLLHGMPNLYNKLFVLFANSQSTSFLSGSLSKAFQDRGCMLIFELLLWLGVAVFAVYLIVCVVYSLATWLPQRVGWIPGWDETFRYKARRWVEKLSSKLFKLTGIFLVIGSMPFVAMKIGGWIQMLGPGGILGGMMSGVWAYSKSGKTEQGGVPLGLVAVVGSSLLIYSLLLVAYCIAAWARFEDYGLYLVIGAFVIGWVVNLNYISIHRFYRDRLTEAFMPDFHRMASLKTKPAVGADKARISEFWDQKNPKGPYHIINTNVILVGSSDRTRRIRGGDNFILSPLYCGSNATGWSRTQDFYGGKMTLATAMAISGAAVNPHTGVGGVGVIRNCAVALLMSILNLGLGFWVTHPKPGKSWRKCPNHFHPGLYELFNFGYSKNRSFLQLSDGGHFENLALYELIRRRMRLIILCDGAADKKFSFGDFQTAIRRIEADFGVRIEFNESNHLERMIPMHSAGYPPGSKFADQGHIVGEITYSDNTKATLIYLKTTMVRNLSLQTKGYKVVNPDFPDQSTADQFFDEDQFEAYRELGYRLGIQMIDGTKLVDRIAKIEK